MKFCGFAGTGVQDGDTRLETMANAMRHDPDVKYRSYYFRSGGLAIVKQPADTSDLIWNKDRSLCLAISGRVTNSSGGRLCAGHDLSAGIGESLIDMLSHSPVETLRRLDGVYGIALYDLTSDTLTLAADRFGFMPVYYYHRDGLTVFASEVKAILKVLQSSKLDWNGVTDFFYVGHMLGSRTLFDGVRALDPGEFIIYSGGKSRRERYYDFTQIKVLSRDQVSTDRVASLFMTAVEQRARKDMPHTVLLSGGLDSRLVLGALRAAGITPRTISLEHAGELHGADGKLGCRVAESLGLKAELRPTRKGFAGSDDWLATFYILDGMVPNLDLFISEVHKELNPGLGMVWDGLALDLTLGGSHQSSGSIEANVKRFPAQRLANRFLLRIIMAARDFRRMDDSFLKRLAAEVATIPPSQNQFVLFLCKNLVRRRAALNPYQLYSTRVEPVTPSTDTSFLEYVLGIPSEFKLSHKLYIELLKRHFPQLTEVPVVSGGRILPFAPERRLEQGWLARNFSRIRRLLSARRDSADSIIRILQIRNFDRPFYRRRLLRVLFAFYRRRISILHPLFKAVCYIELWHLLFFDTNSPLRFDPDGLGVERSTHPDRV